MSKYTVAGIGVDLMTNSYIHAALWAETISLPVAEEDLVDGCMDVSEDHPLYEIPECEPFDSYFDVDDCTEEFVRAAIADCAEFKRRCEQCDRGAGCTLWEELTEIADDESDIGYDFWLTRNHHGAGFWDGDFDNSEELPEGLDNAGDAATAIAQEFSEINMWATEEGRIDLM